MKLQGKVAVITGAGRGIGRAIAKMFALEGADIVINYSKSKKEAFSLADEINKDGREKLVVKADVSKADEVKKMIQKTVTKFGRIDILVNNAGIAIPAAFLDSTEDMWDQTIGVNLKGAYLCSKEVAPIMLNQKSGKIINISSIAGMAERTAVNNTPYVVSKAGMIGLTRSLAVNLSPHINVNAICPGLIDTDMVEATFTPERKKTAIQEYPLKRMGRPEEIARAALFLASDDSDFITGEILAVAGGKAMR
jgi:3-oxoacyl-[acyl-carrier protein] reductase